MLQRIYLPIIIIAAVIFAIYLGMAVHKFLNQSRYVYFPTKEIHETPEDAGIGFEDIYFTASDGTKLNGWYVPSKDNYNNYTILILHGNGGNISDRIGLIKIFNEIGFPVFIIDYRGYGNSGGEPSEEGTYKDAEAAWDYLLTKKKLKEPAIAVFGRSLGGPIAARIASKYSPAALILDSTFTSIKDVGSQIYPYLPVKKFFTYDYNTLQFLKEVSCPVMVMHSRQDRYISFSHAQKIFNAIEGKKELVVLKGSHNNTVEMSEDIYKDKILSFLNSAENNSN